MPSILEEKFFRFISPNLPNGIKDILGELLATLAKLSRPTKTFAFQGSKYNYFFHKYNVAWRNERTVEIPIIKKIVDEYRGKKILEVGNVLSHYFTLHHDIVDKYEKAKNVINKDITEYNPEKKYDLIISVSTLEHIGWEEKPKKPEKYEIAINHLKKMLVKGGKLIVTLPVGYNSFIDNKLKIRKLGFDKTYYMERYSRYNEWRQSGWKRAKEMKFNSPFRYANTIVIGIISG